MPQRTFRCPRADASRSAKGDPRLCAVRAVRARALGLTGTLHSLQVSERLSQPGVAIGLAWTPLGGEIMFVEASRMEGEGQLTLTGQLGDIMKESAHLAISWLRSNAKKYHLTNGEGRGRRRGAPAGGTGRGTGSPSLRSVASEPGKGRGGPCGRPCRPLISEPRGNWLPLQGRLFCF